MSSQPPAALAVALTAIFPLSALAVLVQTGSGAFLGSDRFPPTFGMAITVLGLGSLLLARGTALRWRFLLVVLAIILATMASIRHLALLQQQRGIAGEAPETAYSSRAGRRSDSVEAVRKEIAAPPRARRNPSAYPRIEGQSLTRIDVHQDDQPVTPPDDPALIQPFAREEGRLDGAHGSLTRSRGMWKNQGITDAPEDHRHGRPGRQTRYPAGRSGLEEELRGQRAGAGRALQADLPHRDHALL